MPRWFFAFGVLAGVDWRRGGTKVEGMRPISSSSNYTGATGSATVTVYEPIGSCTNPDDESESESGVVG
jgi:hypothetical protein